MSCYPSSNLFLEFTTSNTSGVPLQTLGYIGYPASNVRVGVKID